MHILWHFMTISILSPSHPRLLEGNRHRVWLSLSPQITMWFSQGRRIWHGHWSIWSVTPRVLGFCLGNLPVAWESVSCELRVLSRRGLCVGPITCPEKSYWVWCVWVWSWILGNVGAVARWRKTDDTFRRRCTDISQRVTQIHVFKANSALLSSKRMSLSCLLPGQKHFIVLVAERSGLETTYIK